MDGAGKSTQIKRLQQQLTEWGQVPLLLNDPGSTGVGEQLRTLILKSGLVLEPVVELLLFEAARAQMVREKIRPALVGGQIVLSDRYADATWAYQGALGIDDRTLWWLNQLACEDVWPDITFLLDLPVEQALERLPGERRDPIEGRGRPYFEKVRARFLRLAATYPQRICVIDASRSPDEVEAQIVEEVQRKLSEKGMVSR